jgi:hypothetical protein
VPVTVTVSPTLPVTGEREMFGITVYEAVAEFGVPLDSAPVTV